MTGSAMPEVAEHCRPSFETSGAGGYSIATEALAGLQESQEYKTEGLESFALSQSIWACR